MHEVEAAVPSPATLLMGFPLLGFEWVGWRMTEEEKKRGATSSER